MTLAGFLSAAFLAGILVFPSLKAGFNAITLTTAISWTNKSAVVKTLAQSLKRAPGHYLDAVLHRSDVPSVRIDIKFKHYEKIRRQRETALARGYLDAGGDDFVPARIRFQGRNIRVKLRLKGDLPDHYQTDRWSFRIKVRGDGHLFGMRRFSIQHPMVRRYHREPLYLDHLRRQGVLAPRYFFIRAIVNGKDLGLMALEEHFSKELLESQQRREGVILKFSGDNWWHFKSRYGGRPGPYFDFMVSDIEAYQNNRINKNPRLQKQRNLATGLLRGFLEGRLRTSAVFDIGLMARYLVINKLWNAEHTMVLDNLRLYLNPVTMLLEPIGFDGVPLLDVKEPSAGPPRGIFYKRVFDDPAFRTAYFSAARRIGEETQGEEFRNWVNEREEGHLKVLHLENPLIPHFLGDVVQRHARTVALFNEDMLAIENADLALAIPGVRFPQVVKAYVVGEGDSRFLELRNIMPVNLTVTDLSIVDKQGKARPLFPAASMPGLPMLFPARTQGETGRVVRLGLAGTDLQTKQTIVVTAQVAGHEGSYRETAIAYSDLEKKPALPQALSIEETLLTHPFLQWQVNTKMFTALAGEWAVDGDIILPHGAGLTLTPGTQLLFQPDAIVLSHGPLSFLGTPQNPIQLQASDPLQGWGGVAVLDSPVPSQLSHVTIKNMRGIARDGWELTGGVSFHRSDTDISDTLFADIEAEDALNIIRSTFSLSQTAFSSIRSDAVDSDFSRGKITGGLYNDIGGDGIDVSGTEILVDGAVLKNVNDKGLSIGEGSNARINNVSVTGAGTGIVSKDGSHTVIDGAKFSNILHAGLMSYIKKPTYGPGLLEATNVELQNAGEDAVAQTGNTLSLNGKTVKPRDIDIDALYSKGYMKK